MGVDELRRGLEMAQLDDDADFGPPATPELISAAEEYLGVEFPPTYREFVASVGCGSFAGREIYGITPSGVDAKAIPSVIFATMDERRHGLPPQFILIEDPGGEEEYVLDTQDLGPNGEAPVKVWTLGSDPANLEVVADDFGYYLLQAAETASA
jgi:cell wall assembly regulator SMI1